MAFVANWNSRELFLLSTTTMALGVGYVTWSFGLSMALGAFVAGLVINESEYAHQALSDIMPLRDLFGMLFFVSVGMLLDPAVVWQQLGVLLFVVSAIVVGKAAILAGVVRAFGYWNVVPLAVGLTLFQIGEFAFVLARVGLSSGAIANDVYTLTLNTAIVTMMLTPAVSGLGLDPILWTSSERWIRWPEWDHASRDDGHGGSSPRSSWAARSGWSWMKGRRSAPSRASWISPRRRSPIGSGTRVRIGPRVAPA